MTLSNAGSGLGFYSVDFQGQKAQIEEEMFLGLRKILGVDKNVFENRFGLSMMDVYGDVIEKLKQQKLITDYT
jgi:coproporphyrinogen III oxidase-like Fe-S oxidoreductase